MPRVIAVRVGRLPSPLRAQVDGLGLSDAADAVSSALRSAAEAVGISDAVATQLASGDAAVFGGNFGGTF